MATNWRTAEYLIFGTSWYFHGTEHEMAKGEGYVRRQDRETVNEERDEETG